MTTSPGPPAGPVSLGARDLIDAERRRQRGRYSTAHDAEHGPVPLLAAAHCYEAGRETFPGWPWHTSAWNPEDPVRNLVKAGALFQAAADCCPRRFSFLSGLAAAVAGRKRCEQALEQLLTAQSVERP